MNKEITPKKAENIYAALCKFQASINTVEKTRKGYNFVYADLSDIWEVIRKPLTDNGLSIIQLVQSEDGKNYIITKLLHVSGACIESKTLIEFTAKKFQDVGTAITYYRRYSLSSMIGIVSDQDVDDKLEKQKEIYEPSKLYISKDQLATIENLINGHSEIRQRMVKQYKSLNQILATDFETVVKAVLKLIADKEKK